MKNIRLTDKGRAVLDGTLVKFCAVCGKRVDLNRDALWWEPDDDSFTHKSCVPTRIEWR